MRQALVWCLAGCMTAGLACVAMAAPGVRTPPTTPTKRLLRVVVSGFKNSKGYMACLAFRGAKGFPGKAKKAAQAARSRLKNKRGVCLFKGLPAGMYAVSVIHDANENQKLDTGFLGIPREGYGFSNNARGTFGPPPFKKAAFRYHRKVQKIHIRIIN